MVFAALVAFSAGCSGGSTETPAATATPATAADAAYLQMAKDYVFKVTAPGTPWTGPMTGPAAQGKKLIVYVSSDQRNGGPQGAGDGAQEAAKAMGWTLRILDGQGSVQGRTTALNQAKTPNQPAYAPPSSSAPGPSDAPAGSSPATPFTD